MLLIQSKYFCHVKFEIKALDEAVSLGIKSFKIGEETEFTQSYYIGEILKKFDQFHNSPEKTPYDSNLHLRKHIEEYS